MAGYALAPEGADRAAPEAPVTEPIADLLAILARGETLAVLAVVALAATVRGFAGFGAGMIYIPVAAAIYGPKVAAATLLLFDLPAVIPATIRLLPQADVRDVAPIALGGLLGVPLGFLALTALDPAGARWVISAIVIVCVAALASGWRVRGEVGPLVTAGVGVTSGFLNGLAQIGAPPGCCSGSAATARRRRSAPRPRSTSRSAAASP